MADSEQAFSFVMGNEDSVLSGIVVPEPDNAKARFGVNSIAHPEAVTDGFYEMPKDQALAYAKEVFRSGYWNSVAGNGIASQVIANKVVDLAFNTGVNATIKILQRAVNAVMGNFVLHVDGVMGPQTVSRVNGLVIDELLAKIKVYAVQHYQDIVKRRPSDTIYLKGWLARVEK